VIEILPHAATSPRVLFGDEIFEAQLDPRVGPAVASAVAATATGI
jgi:hypothetical protein